METGHEAPSLAVLEKWAKALDLELYQLFFVGEGKPEASIIPEHIRLPAQERSLLDLFRQLGSGDRWLAVSLVRDMMRRINKRR